MTLAHEFGHILLGAGHVGSSRYSAAQVVVGALVIRGVGELYGGQAFELPPVPLREDSYGIVRVVGSRVTLDSIVAVFARVATPEEVVQSFPSLGLGDVYAVLAWVVSRRAEVDDYLARRARPGLRCRVGTTSARAAKEHFLPGGVSGRAVVRAGAASRGRR